MLPAPAAGFTPAEAFRVPADAVNSVMLSCFDRDSLQASEMGLEVGWCWVGEVVAQALREVLVEEGRGEKKTDKSLHQSLVTEHILSCDLAGFAALTSWKNSQCRVRCCTLHYEYSEVI